MDLQVQKSLAAVLVLAEASKETEELLKTGRSRGNPELQGLQSRDDHEHHVIRGNEESAILIAARTDNTTRLQLLLQCHRRPSLHGERYKENSKVAHHDLQY